MLHILVCVPGIKCIHFWCVYFGFVAMLSIIDPNGLSKVPGLIDRFEYFVQSYGVIFRGGTFNNATERETHNFVHQLVDYTK